MRWADLFDSLVGVSAQFSNDRENLGLVGVVWAVGRLCNNLPSFQ